VGRETFGSNWQENCTDDPESEQQCIAHNNLHTALESGHVRAFWHDFDHERDLTPIDVAGEFFRINLDQNCIHLSFFAGQPIQCRIHADDLIAFIQAQGELAPPTTIREITECKKWIVARIQNDEKISPVKYLEEEAKKKFPNISGRGFKRAREAAIEETGRNDLREAGRPPQSQ
jgi:hypothetical protein